jgi:hypothetical protein
LCRGILRDANTIERTMHSFSGALSFAARLDELSDADSLQDGRFPARNTRLENTLPDERVASYLPLGDVDLGAGAAVDKLDAWNGHHDAYLAAHVRRGYRAVPFEPADADTPETFRFRHRLDEYGHLDPGLDLLRVENLAYIARLTGEGTQELTTLAEAVGLDRRNGSNSPRAGELDDVLAIWQEATDLDNRPVFAAFWNDATDLLAEPRRGWPDELRDRLGLAHLAPAARSRHGGIPIVVFRYAAAIIPRVPRSPLRFVARPTVLDGALSPAFCTSPAGSGRGCALDLGEHDDAPWQEVIHPAVTFGARHVWASGTITRDVPDTLASARGLHYVQLCLTGHSDFVGLVEDVERDLL